MDVQVLAANFKRLMDGLDEQSEQHPPQSGHDPGPDDAFEHYFVPEVPDDYTTLQPVTDLNDPYGIYDDHLLEETEETKDVKVTNVANAKYRAKRTGFQGLLASVLVGVGGVLANLQVEGDLDWKLLAFAVGQAVLTAVISFLHPDKSAEASE